MKRRKRGKTTDPFTRRQWLQLPWMTALMKHNDEIMTINFDLSEQNLVQSPLSERLSICLKAYPSTDDWNWHRIWSQPARRCWFTFLTVVTVLPKRSVLPGLSIDPHHSYLFRIRSILYQRPHFTSHQILLPSAPLIFVIKLKPHLYSLSLQTSSHFPPH